MTARAASLDLLPDFSRSRPMGRKVAAIMQMNETRARETRRRRREFIRAHHPDRGGDRDFFVAGLRAFDAEYEQAPGPLPRVIVVKRRPWPVRPVIAAARRVRYGPRPPRVR